MGTTIMASSGSKPWNELSSAARSPRAASVRKTSQRIAATLAPATRPMGTAHQPSQLCRSPTPMPTKAQALDVVSAIRS